MAYVINRYKQDSLDSGWPVTINDGEVNTTATSLKLFGRGVTNYGEIVAEDFVYLTENFAGSTPPSNPITGQLWYQPLVPGKGYLYMYAGSNQWIRIKSNYNDTTAPSAPQVGDLWFNTSDNSLNYWNGTAWVTLSTGNAGTNPGPTAPASPQVGMLWYNTNTQVLTIWNGAYWQVIGGGGATVDPGTDFGGNEVVIQMVDDQVLGVWAATALTVGQLPTAKVVNGTTFNFQTLFPNGMGVGLNLSNVTNNRFRGTATSANYADLAERYEADTAYMPGTLVKLGGEKEITIANSFADTNVFGVISENPAFMMNSSAGTDETHPFVALAGRVFVATRGRVQKGDRMISSEVPGVAQALVDATTVSHVWAVFGRALQDKNTDSIGLVEVVVGAK